MTCYLVHIQRETSPSTRGNTMNKHIIIPAPTDVFELTIFTEEECWNMAADGLVTYDEADHMVDGISLHTARQYLSDYVCPCDVCN